MHRSIALFGLFAVACGASAAPASRPSETPAERVSDDPLVHVARLDDAGGRADAVANLARIYGAALERAGGEHDAEGPRVVADVAVPALVRAYSGPETEIELGQAILAALAEMHDARSGPAFLRALDWVEEVSEEHTVTAARAFRDLVLPDEARGEMIDALGASLARVVGDRGVDNRMRIEILRTLGRSGDVRAAPFLREVMLRSDPRQSFLINRLACEELGRLRDVGSVRALILGLLAFEATSPAMRMNDLASAALVRVGEPALAPLLTAFAGGDAELNALAASYVEAVRARSPEAAETMSVEAIVSNEVSFTLGQLGLPGALEPLLSETAILDRGERRTEVEGDLADLQRIFGAALALVSLRVAEADVPRVRDALVMVYGRIPPGSDFSRPGRAQLLVAMQHANDAGLVPFLLTEARPPRHGEGDLDVRMLAFRAAMMLADASVATELQSILDAEPEGDLRDAMTSFEPEVLLPLVRTCDHDLGCWMSRLSDPASTVARKAAAMVALLGRGDETAIRALVAATTTRDEEVMVEILYALDACAVDGSPEALARIEAMREEGSGTAFWSHIEALATIIAARLEVRASAR